MHSLRFAKQICLKIPHSVKLIRGSIAILRASASRLLSPPPTRLLRPANQGCRIPRIISYTGCFVKSSYINRLSEIVITGILRHYLFCSMLKQIFTAATFLVILSSCGKMKNPEFRGIESISMEDVKLGTNTIRLNLKYYNPNSFKGQLKWAEGDAWVDSSFLGHFTVDTALKVPPRQEFIVPVKLNVSMQDMLMVAAPLLSEKKTAIWLRVSGQARAGRGGVYKTVPLKYAGKQSLEELVKE